MALIYRQTKGSALTIQELDGNFQHFTGSHSVTGSFTTSGSLIVTGSSIFLGSSVITGSSVVTGSVDISGLVTINNVSGALLTPTASLLGIAPTFNGSEGQFLFGSGSEGYKMFVWLGGAWRSGSLV
jgi:hypothetical protein